MTETEAYPGGMEIEDLCDFTWQQAETFRNVLVIVNTTECAKQVYEKIKSSCSDEDQVFHLSNKLCPQNKGDTWKRSMRHYEKIENPDIQAE